MNAGENVKMDTLLQGRAAVCPGREIAVYKHMQAEQVKMGGTLNGP